MARNDRAPAALYRGTVVHKRLRPRAHALSYGVVSMLIDVDRIAEAAAATRLFAHNRFAPVSFHDRDHGPGDGTPPAKHARKLLREAGLHMSEITRIELLCYPRVFGYAFNPLSVYFAYGEHAERLEAIIYEVNNTFGERVSYVVKAGVTGPDQTYAQSCDKQMFVSPFAKGTGSYGFRVRPPGPECLVGVNLRDEQGALLKTHFRGSRQPFTDANLGRLFVIRPYMSLKVIAAIHFEAARLWLKGVPVVQRHRSPRYSVSQARHEAR